MSFFRSDPLTFLAQETYRSLLAALARPGSIHQLNLTMPGGFLAGQTPQPLLAAAFALLDEQVRVASWGAEAARWATEVADRTGARIDTPEDADFVLCSVAPTLPMLGTVRRGSPLSPEDGSTLLIWIDAPLEGSVGTAQLSGPGLPSPKRLATSGPLLGFLRHRTAIAFEYPMGFDAFLFGSDGGVMGLPRTTSVLLSPQGRR